MQHPVDLTEMFACGFTHRLNMCRVGDVELRHRWSRRELLCSALRDRQATTSACQQHLCALRSRQFSYSVGE